MDESTTFDDLGFHFEYFKAPVSHSDGYLGISDCTVCGRKDAPVIEISVGADLIVECRSCGMANAMDADDEIAPPCTNCGGVAGFPEKKKDEHQACCECLLTGRVAISKDTRVGILSWHSVRNGAFAVDAAKSEWQLNEQCHDDGTPNTRLEIDTLDSLLRTPSYFCWQNDLWPFHCGRPMAFLGCWEQAEFNQAAPDGDGLALFNAIVYSPDQAVWENRLHDERGIYVFRCTKCPKLWGYWDVA